MYYILICCLIIFLLSYMRYKYKFIYYMTTMSYFYRNNNGSPVSRSKIIDLSAAATENGLYEPIPPKATVSVDNATTAILE